MVRTPKCRNIGYIRVSTVDQNTDRQAKELAELDIKLDKTFTDHASGKDTKRPQLEKMLDYAREGDTITVHSMDRLARNLGDLRKLVDAITGKGIRLHFIKENLTFSGDDSAMSVLLLSVMGAFAEFERALLKERQREGIAIAKSKGLYKGRKKALSQEQVETLKARIAAGESKTNVAKDLSISRETLYQYIRANGVCLA